MSTLALCGICAGVLTLGVAVVIGVVVVTLMRVSSKAYLDSEELNMKGEYFL